MSWRKTEKLMDTIRHYASFPATGVSLRQMVQFGERPSVGEFLQCLWPVSTLHAVEPIDGPNAHVSLSLQGPYSAPPSSSPRNSP